MVRPDSPLDVRFRVSSVINLFKTAVGIRRSRLRAMRAISRGSFATPLPVLAEIRRIGAKRAKGNLLYTSRRNCSATFAGPAMSHLLATRIRPFPFSIA